MNIAFMKILAVCTNWLRRKGCNILAEKISNWLYNRIDIDNMIGEVYVDCEERMIKKDPSIAKKWRWMQKEHMEYLFGGRTLSQMQPESVALVREFEELLPKKHYVAMMALEAYKADERNDKITTMLQEVLKRLNIPDGDAIVTFAEGYNEQEIAPKYLQILYRKKKENIPPQKLTQEEIAEAVIKGSSIEVLLKQMEYQRSLLPNAQITKVYPVYGHRNESYVPVEFWVGNIGNTLVPNCDVIITCPEGTEVKRENEEMFTIKLVERSGIMITNCNTIHINVGDLKRNRSKHFGPIFIKVPHDEQVVILSWSLSSNTIEKSGVLKLINHPRYEYKPRYVDDPETREIEIEDYIVDISDRDKEN